MTEPQNESEIESSDNVEETEEESKSTTEDFEAPEEQEEPRTGKGSLD